VVVVRPAARIAYRPSASPTRRGYPRAEGAVVFARAGGVGARQSTQEALICRCSSHQAGHPEVDPERATAGGRPGPASLQCRPANNRFEGYRDSNPRSPLAKEWTLLGWEAGQDPRPSPHKLPGRGVSARPPTRLPHRALTLVNQLLADCSLPLAGISRASGRRLRPRVGTGHGLRRLGLA
jgi:hypothetical protein